jgi:deoxyribonuclease-4
MPSALDRRPASAADLPLGAQMSIAGGVDRAVDRAVAAGCRALQIFTRSSRQWRARPLPAAEIEAFRRKLRDHRIGPVVAHNSYLVNLASPEPARWRRSVAAMVEELERCEALGVPALVAHPGAHLGAGPEAGIARVARALDEIERRTRGLRARVVLETAAGQGTALGASFAEIGAILRRVRRPERFGVCVDTCHAFAAGYDLATAGGWERTWEEFEREIGLRKLEVLHVNDSARERGSRVDRHASIGKGRMGLRPFRLLVNDPRLAGRPMLLETPKSEEGEEDRRNLRTLRALVGRRRAPARRRVS